LARARAAPVEVARARAASVEVARARAASVEVARARAASVEVARARAASVVETRLRAVRARETARVTAAREMERQEEGLQSTMAEKDQATAVAGWVTEAAEMQAVAVQALGTALEAVGRLGMEKEAAATVVAGMATEAAATVAAGMATKAGATVAAGMATAAAATVVAMRRGQARAGAGLRRCHSNPMPDYLGRTAGIGCTNYAA